MLVTGADGVLRTLQADVSNTEQVNAAVEQVVAETGQIDVVVNNAGILRDKVLWKLEDPGQANYATRMVASIPEDRLAEIAPAIAFLASDEAAYITGVVLPVDGGLSM